MGRDDRILWRGRVKVEDRIGQCGGRRPIRGLSGSDILALFK